VLQWGSVLLSRRSRPTLDKVKQGSLTCGVPTGSRGFAQPEQPGQYAGFDVDFCRAIMAGRSPGDPRKGQYVPLNAHSASLPCESGEVDIPVQHTTWTLFRATPSSGSISARWCLL